jgi:hypothetical protein
MPVFEEVLHQLRIDEVACETSSYRELRRQAPGIPGFRQQFGLLGITDSTSPPPEPVDGQRPFSQATGYCRVGSPRPQTASMSPWRSMQAGARTRMS